MVYFSSVHHNYSDFEKSLVSYNFSFLLYVSGCFELENGNVVWPASHVCTTAVHNCYDIDRAFNNSGTVTRYCSNTGQWQDPDYSQCFLIPGTKPFVHLYLTFYTLSYPHIRNNLQNIIRSVCSNLALHICIYILLLFREIVYFLYLM